VVEKEGVETDGKETIEQKMLRQAAIMP